MTTLLLRGALPPVRGSLALLKQPAVRRPALSHSAVLRHGLHSTAKHLKSSNEESHLRSAAKALEDMAQSVKVAVEGTEGNDGAAGREPSEASGAAASSVEPDKVYVGNLTRNMDVERLKEAFAKYGKIVDAKVVKSTKNPEFVFGFLTFSGAEAAQMAIEGANGQEYDGRAIRVALPTPLDPTRAAARERGPTRSRRLFVDAIEEGVTEETLRAAFQEHGEVQSHRLHEQPRPLESTRSAHVVYATQADADRALEALNGTTLSGVRTALKVAYSTKGAPPPQSGNLFVEGFESETTQDMLREAFGKYGTLAGLHNANAKQKMRSKRDANFAFVKFEKLEDAGRALEALNGSQLGGATIKVERANRAGPRTRPPRGEVGAEKAGDQATDAAVTPS